MSEKRIILEYLRNQQKAAEIEAKVNGINLWVLVGAIAVISWKLIDLFDIAMLRQPELTLRILVCAEAIYIFFWVCSRSKFNRNDLRYNQLNANEINSPLLIIVEGLWGILPPMLFLLFVGNEFNIYIMLMFNFLIHIAFGLWVIFSLLKSPGMGSDRFPKDGFTSSSQSSLINELIFGSLFVFVAFSQGISIAHSITVTTNVIKFYALLVSFYLLVTVAMKRHRSSQGIQWTYDLETDVLVDAISSEVAIRRIENRALGPKLEDVMNAFFDDIDKKIQLFEESIAACQIPLENIKKIPKDFKVERKGRVDKATTEVRQNLDVLQSDINDFSNYIEKLTKVKFDQRLTLALQGLVTKRDVYKKRVNQLKTEFDISVQKSLEEVVEVDQSPLP